VAAFSASATTAAFIAVPASRQSIFSRVLFSILLNNHSFFCPSPITRSLAMPPKKAGQLKRAADELDHVLENSPVHKKKSKSNLQQPEVAIPSNVVPPPAATTPDPGFVDRFEPEAALRLTKATNSLNYAVDKINFYADLLSTFDNERDDQAIALAERANGKIEKWGSYRDKVQKSMDVLMKVAPKKKAGASLNAQTAEGFLSSSGKLPSLYPPVEMFCTISPISSINFSPYSVHGLTRPFLFRILSVQFIHSAYSPLLLLNESSWTTYSPLIRAIAIPYCATHVRHTPRLMVACPIHDPGLR
jgi:hypothetical protein